MSIILTNDYQQLTVSNIKTSDLSTSKLIFSKCCIFKLDSFTKLGPTSGAEAHATKNHITRHLSNGQFQVTVFLSVLLRLVM